MRILPGLLWGCLNLLCVGIDVVILLLLCRLLLMWRSIRLIEQLNELGKGLVDALLSNTSQLWCRAAQKRLSAKGELLVSLAALSVVRLLLCEIARFL